MQTLHFSTKRISSKLLELITESIRGKTYGSTEIYIQDSQVTQITERMITKFNGNSNGKPGNGKSTDVSVSELMQPLHFSTKRISSKLLELIAESIRGKTYGSVEIYIQDSQVTQITERMITKFNGNSNGKPGNGKSTDRQD